jgi:Fuc2NAc and GlcNAc transferase
MAGMHYQSTLVALVSALLTCYLLHVCIPLLQKVLPDKPNARSLHARVTPRGGGIIFVLIGLVASVLFYRSGDAAGLVIIIASPLAVLSLIDDRVGLPANIRYVMHLLTATALVMASSLAISVTWIAVPLIIIAITAMINFANFMDGLDGLVAGCMTVCITTAAVYHYSTLAIWALVGALIGFLRWNWHPAKVFMGDVGSTFLGAVVAGIVLQAPQWSSSLGLLLVLTPLMGDAFFCVVRRWKSGQSVLEAHRLHLYQRLHQAGWSQDRVASLYITATSLVALTFFWGGLHWEIIVAGLMLLIGIWLDKKIAVPFELASSK